MTSTAVVGDADFTRVCTKDLLVGVIQHAEFQAELVIAALKECGVLPAKRKRNAAPIGIPEAVLRELGAVMELGMWEHGGIRDHLGVGLPNYREASDQLADRLEKGPDEFTGPESTALSDAVFKFWVDRFYWHAEGDLGAGVVRRPVDVDLLGRVVADVLWNHYESLSTLLSNVEK